jgi:hypothetical protein
MEKAIRIDGMQSDACETMLRLAAEEVPGAKLLSISHETGDAVISAPDGRALNAVIRAFEAEGYKVHL